MIFSKKHLVRFSKLYYSFISYANRRLRATDYLHDEYDHLIEDETFTVAEAVWANGSNPSLVGDYVQENPDRLPPGDLRRIAQWEHALIGIFLVQRQGRDVLFGTHGTAIAVRGFVKEIDDTLGVDHPVLVNAILLPYENAVVFPLVAEMLDEDSDDAAMLHHLHEMGRITPDTKIIRTASDFVATADTLQKTMPRLAVDLPPYGDGDPNPLCDADDEIDGQHRGIFAGLTGHERVQAKGKYDEERAGERARTMFDHYHSRAIREKPPKNMRELYSHLSREELLSSVRELNIEGNIGSLSKRTLLDLMVSVLTLNIERALLILRKHGLSSLMFARELQEAGGMIEFSSQDAADRGEVAPPAPPVFAYFATDTTLIGWMLSEYVSCLADVDWEAEIEDARRLDQARQFFNTVTQLRGIDVLEEVMEEYKTYVGGDQNMAREEDLDDMLTNGVFSDTANFIAYDCDGTTMLVNGMFTNPRTGRFDNRNIRAIIKAQADKPKRPITPSMVETKYFDDWLEEATPEAQDLIAYLDEHVPDTQSDFTFADDLFDCVFIEAQLSEQRIDFTRILRDYDFYTTFAQINRFNELVDNASDHLPRWINRGWSPKDMLDLEESGTWVPTNLS